MAGYNPNEFFKGKVQPVSDPIITFDPSIIKKKEKVNETTKKVMNKDSSGVVSSMSGFAKQNKIANYSAVTSGQKSDRKFNLSNAIQIRKVRNLNEATEFLGVKAPTIRRYLRELGYSLDRLDNIVK